jgi:hypothetical protein
LVVVAHPYQSVVVVRAVGLLALAALAYLLLRTPRSLSIKEVLYFKTHPR